ncbi:AAA family ATPase [Pseudaestuariivita rosea]|uniref:AAA family ATPase n=1 Tax=Pseudaestuariivita rosea TaxID=2763263 RepID=UPI001ABB0DF8|nr:AAA family ATPase [Pseudaestuariivita rosea]
MIIVLNGYPGVGKLTIGRVLADQLHGRLLDIHTVYNVAFALTEFKSKLFKETTRQIERIAHDLILQLPADVPVVLTTVLTGDSDWATEEWENLLTLGKARPPFCVVHLRCDLDENIRRIKDPGRAAKRKPQEAEYAIRNHGNGAVLKGLDVPNLLRLDVTNRGADSAAEEIAGWARKL